ncbi:hypothetical protein AZA_85645 [Nitrospirillum viridazoti Y2]|nr:hypothetical protein AZA_85645 [Nitrospirillum amazonense Y2]
MAAMMASVSGRGAGPPMRAVSPGIRVTRAPALSGMVMAQRVSSNSAMGRRLR